MRDELLAGYLDGGNLENPEPGPNRSPAYVHGFWRGRDDAEVAVGIRSDPRMTAQEAREAWEAIEAGTVRLT